MYTEHHYLFIKYAIMLMARCCRSLLAVVDLRPDAPHIRSSSVKGPSSK